MSRGSSVLERTFAQDEGKSLPKRDQIPAEGRDGPAALRFDQGSGGARRGQLPDGQQGSQRRRRPRVHRNRGADPGGRGRARVRPNTIARSLVQRATATIGLVASDATDVLGLGHTSIGTVTGTFRRRVTRSRLHGYEDALRGAGLEPSEDLVAEGDWTPQGGAVATRLLLERSPGLTAIFVHSDVMAIGVLSALWQTGRRVPADVAVVSCDDIPFAEFLTPPLTTVRVPLAETGRQAVELLLRGIAGEPVPERTPLLPVELIVRDSCGGRTG